MERTCKRCGTVWYLPIRQARETKPSRLEIGAAKMQAHGARMSLGLSGTHRGGYEAAATNLENRRIRVEQNRQCPNCGSSSFTERKVKG